MKSERWPSVVATRNTLCGLIAGVALSWAAFGRTAPPALAQGPNSGEKSETIAFTSGGGQAGSAQMLYLIDTKNQALAVYRVEPQNSAGAVKLLASRQYRWDLKLAEYNNLPPDVASIESMVGTPGKK